MIGIYREELETKRDIIKGKIDKLEMYCDNKFVLENKGETFEFKIISVAGDKYKVFGGFGYALRVFPNHVDSEQIISEFESALKGMELQINECKFINPLHFK